jgi:hypothetical protein
VTTISLLQWWLEDPEMREMINAKFAMYLYYYQKRHSGKTDGVLWNMMFSITRQLARQDLAIYRAFVNLRNDQET